MTTAAVILYIITGMSNSERVTFERFDTMAQCITVRNAIVSTDYNQWPRIEPERAICIQLPEGRP